MWWQIGGWTTAVLAAGAYGVWKAAVLAQRPPRHPVAARPSVPYEEVEWTSGGGRVRGWWLPQPGVAPAPVVVVAHGWGSNRSRVLRYAEPLHAAGYAVLVYDVRSHGESDPVAAPSALLFRDDLLAALDWVAGRPDADPRRIGVLGHSLGGFGAVLALDEGARIAALVTDAMPVRFAAMVEAELSRRRLPRFPLAWLIPPVMLLRSRISRRTMRRADPVRILADNARRGGVPALHVHSRRDGLIPPSELGLVLERLPDAARLFVDVEGHSRSEQDPAFWPAVLAFLDAHLHKKGARGAPQAPSI